ncbi:NAD-dependent protein deacylase [Garciella nitratireducens]|uniref:NAD-dependent protein deacylase n=1 Tax=Garciella nitratireducens TaxID=218205 RepID=UPI000DEBF25E|nr:NAD-dependent protein deacylase [Garciella nitratireducens]RBP42226.1 NAD-dependent deacetylase [Garciella nitratireducens]
MRKEQEKLKQMIENSDNIVFFGGAGVSTESNIPDFRSESGIYKTQTQYGYPPEIMLSHSFFESHIEEFYDFYKNTMIYQDAKPNPAHYALAQLEKQGKLKAVITQNIDGLHQKAGSQKVLELHGSIYRNYCMHCHQSYQLSYILKSPGVPKCSQCGGIIKPDVVLYEEPLNREVMEEALDYISQADILIVGGTSLAVYPAASLIEYYHGNKLVLINKTPTPYDKRANLVLNQSIGKVLGEIIECEKQ